jgi:EAL domain-containing protein (putative c-di-GMP-specific phosphodiesterase class I)
MLDDREIVHVFMIRIEQEQCLELVVGWERYDHLLGAVADELRSILGAGLGTQSILCQDNYRGDVFFIFIVDRAEAARVLGRASKVITVPARSASDPRTVHLRVGQGSIRRRAVQRTERCIYAGLALAQLDFVQQGALLDEDRRKELRRVLERRLVSTLFQPIIDSPAGEVAGYEALSRGPKGSYLEGAESLFGFAERAGMLGEIELLCFERALESARSLGHVPTLFLNLSFLGLDFLETEAGGLARLVSESAWTPDRCVLEITERTCAENPGRIRKRVAALREQGFRIAIDDMGTGYSSLHVVADLQPDFIKLDQMLVRDLANEPIKRNLVSAIMGFAQSSSTRVIAEGVEREDEVEALRELGVDLLQGFFFGYPVSAEAIATRAETSNAAIDSSPL